MIPTTAPTVVTNYALNFIKQINNTRINKAKIDILF